MTVVCDVNGCPWLDRGFCGKKILVIKENGVCRQFYNYEEDSANGQKLDIYDAKNKTIEN